MKRLISIITALSMLITVSTSTFVTKAQQSSTPQGPGENPMRKLPPGAEIGLSPEAKAAWEKLNPEERKKVQEKLRDIVAKSKDKAAKEKRKNKPAHKEWKDIIKGKENSTDPDTTLIFRDLKWNHRSIKGKERDASVLLDAASQVRLGSGSRSAAVPVQKCPRAILPSTPLNCLYLEKHRLSNHPAQRCVLPFQR